VPLFKVDLKAFRDATYRQLGGVLENVLDTIRRLRQMDFWVEVVTLVVPGLNDSDEELRQIAAFLAGVSPEIPWHVTAFHPDYRMDEPPATPVETLLRAYEHGRAAGLQFVYAGNLPGGVGDREHTHCPGCGTTLIERRGFYVLRNRLISGACPECRRAIPGVWSPPSS
jgi:pyruvate formate lyase activating enzyme